jgi:hypothetical protein
MYNGQVQEPGPPEEHDLHVVLVEVVEIIVVIVVVIFIEVVVGIVFEIVVEVVVEIVIVEVVKVIEIVVFLGDARPMRWEQFATFPAGGLDKIGW